MKLLASEKILHPYHEEPHMLYECIESASLRNSPRSELSRFHFGMDILVRDNGWSRYNDKVQFSVECKECDERPPFTKLNPTLAARLLCHIAKIEAALQLKRTAEAVYVGLLALEDLEAAVQEIRARRSHDEPPAIPEVEKEVLHLTWEEAFCAARVLCLLAESLALISSPPSVALFCLKKASHILQTASNRNSREAEIFLRGEIMLSTAKVYSSLNMFRSAIAVFKSLAKKETGVISVLPPKSRFYWEYLLEYSDSLLQFARVNLSQLELTDSCPVDEFADAPWDRDIARAERKPILLAKIKLALSEAFEHLHEFEDATALMKDVAAILKSRAYVLKLEHNLYNHEYTTHVSVAPKHASERAALRWQIKMSKYVLSSHTCHRLDGYAPYGSGPETYWGARHDLVDLRYEAFKDYCISPTDSRQMCTHATLRTWSNESINFLIGGAEAYSSQGYMDKEYMLWNCAADKIMLHTNERHPLTCLVYRRLLRSIAIHSGRSAEERTEMFRWRLKVAVEVKREAVRQATTGTKAVLTFCDLKAAICTDQHTGAFVMYGHRHRDALLWIRKVDNKAESDAESANSGYNSEDTE